MPFINGCVNLMVHVTFSKFIYEWGQLCRCCYHSMGLKWEHTDSYLLPALCWRHHIVFDGLFMKLSWNEQMTANTYSTIWFLQNSHLEI